MSTFNPSVRARAPWTGRPTPPAEPEPLDEEIALVRAIIGHLDADGDLSPRTRARFVELRRQVVTLCKVLRTRRILDTGSADAVVSEIARALEAHGLAQEADE